MQYGGQIVGKTKRNFEYKSEKAKIRERKLAKARREEKPNIYVSEEILRWKNLRYDIFLTVGGMADISKIHPRELDEIAQRSHDRAPPKEGQLKVSRKTKYHEEVIQRGRKERAKAKELEAQKKMNTKWIDRR